MESFFLLIMLPFWCVLAAVKCVIGQQTCVNGELSLAGVGAGQVLSRAGVDTGVFGAGVEDDEGVFWVVIHKCEVAAFRQKRVVLQKADHLFASSLLVVYYLCCTNMC